MKKAEVKWDYKPLLHFPHKSASTKYGRIGFPQMTHQELYFILKNLDKVCFHMFSCRFENIITGLCKPAEKDYCFRAGKHDGIC